MRRSFCPLEGVVSVIGQETVPSSLKITRGDPAFAHAVAHSELMGLSRPFVNAQAESNTYPFTLALVAFGAPAQASATSDTHASAYSPAENLFMICHPNARKRLAVTGRRFLRSRLKRL